MVHKPTFITVCVMVLGAMLAQVSPALSAPQSQSGSSVPACFIEDTVYYMVLDVERHEFALWYGSWELYSCGFTLAGDTTETVDFAERWRSPDRPMWQKVERRGVWSGRPAVSDTVIAVVSEVSKVDPNLIKRVYPDRFLLEITGGFRILILTPEGANQKRKFDERWSAIKHWLVSFGSFEELTIVVSADDAQSLYYALEPGTPVLLGATDSD